MLKNKRYYSLAYLNTDCFIHEEARCFQIKLVAESNFTEKQKNQQSERVERKGHIDEDKISRECCLSSASKVASSYEHPVLDFRFDYWGIQNHSDFKATVIEPCHLCGFFCLYFVNETISWFLIFSWWRVIKACLYRIFKCADLSLAPFLSFFCEAGSLTWSVDWNISFSEIEGLKNFFFREWN